MSSPARSITGLIPPAVSRHPDPDPLLEIARLKRDLRSLQQRDRTQRRALFELQAGGDVPLTSVATIGPRATPGSVSAVLTMAQHAERHGRVPVVRFARDAQDRVAGLELLFVTPTTADEALLDTLPDGMAVISGDEPA